MQTLFEILPAFVLVHPRSEPLRYAYKSVIETHFCREINLLHSESKIASLKSKSSSRTPTAFRDEPFKLLVMGKDIADFEVGSFTGHTDDQIRLLKEFQLFPRGHRNPETGHFVYNRKKLVAYKWALTQDNWLSSEVKKRLFEKSKNRTLGDGAEP